METKLEQLLATELAAGNAELSTAMSEAKVDTLADFVRACPHALVLTKEQTPEICLEAVQLNGLALEYVEKQTPEICMAAVKQNSRALEYVLEQTPEVCMAAVAQNKFALWYVREQTPEVCMAAVKGEGEASVLNLVDKQTPEICMVAVRQDGEALEYVRERTPEICIEAVKQNARALQFVHELDAIPLALRLEVAGSRHEAFNYSPFDTAPYSPLDTLAKDENEAVRVRVAENPHTCHNTLYALARDKRECEAVRMAVAGNPSTPPELLTELKDGLEGMSKIPTKVGNVDITPKQRKALQDGKSVTLSGLIDKAGNVHKTMHVAFDREAGKVKLTQEKNQSPKAKVKAAPARSRQSKFRL